MTDAGLGLFRQGHRHGSRRSPGFSLTRFVRDLDAWFPLGEDACHQGHQSPEQEDGSEDQAHTNEGNCQAQEE